MAAVASEALRPLWASLAALGTTVAWALQPLASSAAAALAALQ